MLMVFVNDIHSRPPCLNSNLDETLNTYSGNEVEWDRFLCELVDSEMSSRSPWERSKRLKFQMHTLLRVESLVFQVENVKA